MPAPTLLQALGARPGEVIALVGAGGKTTVALRLVAEAAAAGLRAVFTVTTRIYPPPLPTLLGAEPERLAALLAGGPVCVARGPAPGGKLAGLDPAGVAAVAALADVTMVEADGAAGRPLKFPLAHEPVLPPAATLVVPVAGATVLGQPLHPLHVHRAGAAAAFLGAPPGAPVTPEMVAALLWHPGAATRGRPPGARVVPVLNQADAADPVRLTGARTAARALLDLGAPLVVVCGRGVLECHRV